MVLVMTGLTFVAAAPAAASCTGALPVSPGTYVPIPLYLNDDVPKVCASASWTGCSGDTCDADGDHSTDVPTAIGQGELYVDGVLQDTCNFGPGISTGSCDTSDADWDGCHTAEATTTTETIQATSAPDDHPSCVTEELI